MKRLILLFCFFISAQTVFSQSENIDATLLKIASEKDENVRIDLIYNLYFITNETNPELGIKNANRVLLQAQKNKDQISEAMALGRIGANYRLLGNVLEGLKYNLKAMVIAEQTNNFLLIASIQINLGNICKDRKEYRRAINFYLSAEENGSKIGNKKMVGYAYLNSGEVFLAMNNVDSALIYLQRAYELCLLLDYTEYFGKICSNLGEVHGKMGNGSLAISYFNMSINDALETKKPRRFYWPFAGLAQYYHDFNQNDSSIFYAKKAINAVQNTPFALLRIKPAKLLADIYENIKRDSALKYLKMYVVANDSLFNSKSVQQTQLMTFEEELRKQRLAEEKMQIKETRWKNIQYALIAIVLITLISLYLLLSRSYITNTKLIEFFGMIALLFVFEFFNLLFHYFLDEITHHSPVLMLIILVCIAALIIPLHLKIEKWATTKLVEKNKQIRLAIAKKTIEELEVKPIQTQKSNTNEQTS